MHAARARHERLREAAERHVTEAWRRAMPLTEALGSSRHLVAAADAVAEVERAQARAAEALRLARAYVAVLDALVDLLTVWAPACLLLGTGVRTCSWALREAGTGVRARKVPTQSLLLLLRLEGTGDRWRTSKYTLALLVWTPWHDAVPGCCYVEEFNEAALSRLGRSLRQHPEAVSTDAAMDL